MISNKSANLRRYFIIIHNYISELNLNVTWNCTESSQSFGWSWPVAGTSIGLEESARGSFWAWLEIFDIYFGRVKFTYYVSNLIFIVWKKSLYFRLPPPLFALPITHTQGKREQGDPAHPSLFHNPLSSPEYNNFNVHIPFYTPLCLFNNLFWMM